MKRKIIIHFILAIPLVLFFIAAKPTVTYQTQCVSRETDGYISLKIWDTKKGKNYKPEQARKDAIHAILYSGIAGENGCITQNPLLNKPEEQERFAGIEKNFFSKKGIWAQFTRDSDTETTLPERIGKKEWKAYQVSVSKNELRKFLETNSIIISLNNGF